MFTPKLGLFLLNAALALLVYFGLDVEPKVATGLGILTFVALMWLTETFHVSVTSLMVPLLAVVAGIYGVKDALGNFAHPIIFLFLGGFALAAALHKQGLDRAIATRVIRLAGGSLLRASVFLFMIAGFLSMWISNTATAAMMLPLALGLLSQIKYEENKSVYFFVLLGVAYSANIGGIGTLVGSPPNAIAAAAVGLDFAGWMRIGIPVVLLLFPCMILILLVLLRPNLQQSFNQVEEEAFRMTRARWQVLAIFLLTVFMWIFSKPVAATLGIKGGMDTFTALLAIVLLCATRVVEWKDIERNTEWGVLLLFGGGLTLSAILKDTGTSVFLAQAMSNTFGDASFLVFVLILVTFVVFLTELASNTASAALLVPIFVAIADGMGLPAETMAVAIAVSASCAFMLPVATPPNAIVYGTGRVPQRQMMRAGMVLNLFCIVVITGVVSLFY